MEHIAKNLNRLKGDLGSAKLIVVSKYREVEEILAAYQAGQRIFAENRVQALLERREALPADIEWHLIGHLQTNKVKYIAPFIAMIHSIDSLKLLQEVDWQAGRQNRVIDCLLQVHVAKEETKFGFDPDELRTFLQAGDWKELQHVRICGLMAMATNTTDTSLIRSEFMQVRALFDELKVNHFTHSDAFSEVSMGMSSDYPIAVECGSTMVRVGSAVFEG
ncbi:MAG: YggS family pyridoxal phosphate-dependent enzyme [Bacteroidetes bacterium]|nr:YggS family pyridoxal phosphate-dependent enzyme [Bacteroidota bacterium]